MKTSLWGGVAAASMVMALGCGSGEERQQTIVPPPVQTQAVADGEILNTTLLALIPKGRDIGAELILIGKQAEQTGVTITHGAGQGDG